MRLIAMALALGLVGVAGLSRAETTVHGVTIRTAERGTPAHLRVCWVTGSGALDGLRTEAWFFARPYRGVGATVVWCLGDTERSIYRPSSTKLSSFGGAPEDANSNEAELPPGEWVQPTDVEPEPEPSETVTPLPPK